MYVSYRNRFLFALGVDADRGLPCICRLNREILAFVDYISPSAREHATRSHIVALVRRAVTTQWPDAKVMPFGSFETGLYLPTG